MDEDQPGTVKPRFGIVSTTAAVKQVLLPAHFVGRNLTVNHLSTTQFQLWDSMRSLLSENAGFGIMYAVFNKE